MNYPNSRIYYIQQLLGLFEQCLIELGDITWEEWDLILNSELFNIMAETVKINQNLDGVDLT